MYEIKAGSRNVDGKRVDTWKREVFSACAISVEAGTTGFKGGDTGHGCRVYLRLEDLGGADMSCRVLRQKNGNGGIEIAFGGDAELECLINALEFTVQVYKEQIKEAEAYGHTIS